MVYKSPGTSFTRKDALDGTEPYEAASAPTVIHTAKRRMPFPSPLDGRSRSVLWMHHRESLGRVPSQHEAIEYVVFGKGPPVLMVYGAGGGYDQELLFYPHLALDR
jgi:hypothetical protein